MSKFLVGARRSALCLVCMASMLAGGATLWAMLDPETVRGASTWLLLGVLAMLTLPLLTLATFETDRRNVDRRRAARMARQASLDEFEAQVAVRDIAVGSRTIDVQEREPEAPVRRHEPAAQGSSVSARRAARSAPGRSRAAIRR